VRALAAVALAGIRTLGPLFGGLTLACGGSGRFEGGEPRPVVQCTVEAPTACPEPATTYSDVAPVFQSRCVSCHYGVANGPWPLTRYDDVADWRDAIRDDVLDCSMPPPGSGITMDDSERLAILNWARCGGTE
jgi:hypothetical protein